MQSLIFLIDSLAAYTRSLGLHRRHRLFFENQCKTAQKSNENAKFPQPKNSFDCKIWRFHPERLLHKNLAKERSFVARIFFRDEWWNGLHNKKARKIDVTSNCGFRVNIVENCPFGYVYFIWNRGIFYLFSCLADLMCISFEVSLRTLHLFQNWKKKPQPKI